ncbi:unnamed protein product, partial [Owenia fusiformis]
MSSILCHKMSNSKNIAFSEEHIMVRDLPITWIRKVLTWLRCYDIDNDGYAGYDDFMKIADRLIKYGKLKEKAADDVIEFFQTHATASKAGVRSEIMAATGTVQQMLAGWKIKDNPAAIKGWRSGFSLMFKIFDLNSSGFVTFDEYLVFWLVYGLDLRFARMQFDYMDTDGDGKISEEE